MKKCISFIILVVSFSSLGLDLDQMPVPPSYEKTRSFTLLYVNRQPEVPPFLKEKIKALELKKRSTWDGSDSLAYALELAYLNEFTHALNYFVRIETDTIKHPVTLQLLQITYLKTNRFEKLKESIKKSRQSSAVKDIRLRLVDVREMNMNKTWDKNENTIYPILKDSSNYKFKKNQKTYYKFLVSRAEDFKKALLYESIYTDESDKILSQAYEEFGDFLHEHFYLTNAFMAYSISRFYDKRNSSISKKIKGVKSEMDDANFLQPSIRENFMKIDFELYRFKKIAEISSDSLSLQKVNSISLEDIAKMEANKKPDYLPWINYEVLLIIILFFILVVILLFVKTKK